MNSIFTNSPQSPTLRLFTVGDNIKWMDDIENEDIHLKSLMYNLQMILQQNGLNTYNFAITNILRFS
jgi:hypothetical protein